MLTNIQDSSISAISPAISACPQGDQESISNNTQVSYERLLEQIYSDYPFSYAFSFQENSNLKLLSFAKPIIQYFADQLQSITIASLAKNRLPTSLALNLVREFTPELLNRLAIISHKTIILEMHVLKHQQKLKGHSSSERFLNYIQTIQNSEFVEYLTEEYPELFRLLFQAGNHWLSFISEFIERLLDDSESLSDLFGIDKQSLMQVKCLDSTSGDLHNFGRRVMCLDFASGHKLVYKPRDVSSEKTFQQILDWTNKHLDGFYFQTYKVIEKEGYGWCEFITERKYQNSTQAEKYYFNLGALTALLYSLEATDFHSENIIMQGDQPILVDLETLFHSSIPGKLDNYSCLSTGVLPNKIRINAIEFLEVSGFYGHYADQEKTIDTWSEECTDEMQMDRVKVDLATDQKDSPRNRCIIERSDSEREFVKGFNRSFNQLTESKDALAQKLKKIQGLEKVTPRIVARPTSTYSLWLDKSYHPSLLSDSNKRQLFIRALIENDPINLKSRQINAHEELALLCGDIPTFHRVFSSKHLYDQNRNSLANEFFQTTSNDSVKKRLSELDSRDNQRQTWLITSSFKTLNNNIDDFYIRNTFKLEEPNKAINKNKLQSQLENAIQDIATHVKTVAIHGEKRPVWMNLSLNDSGIEFSHSPLTLYDGQLGVILFLAYQGCLLNDNESTKLAQQAFQSAAEQWEGILNDVSDIGLFNGSSGLLFLISHLSNLWPQFNFLPLVESVVSHIKKHFDSDCNYDLIAGVSGTIISCVSLFKVLRMPEIIDLAKMCGDKLLTDSVRSNEGIYWKGKNLNTGFAHGNSGMAFSLARLFETTKDAKYLAAAISAIQYESIYYSENSQNWCDLEKHHEKETNVAWCHGTPGIAIARNEILSHIDEHQDALNFNRIKVELEIALDTTLNQEQHSNFCICHGFLGNYEVLYRLGKAHLTPKQINTIESRISHWINQVNSTEDWQSTPNAELASVQLMTGLSGIGMALLYLYAPNFSPAISFLEPPKLVTNLS